MAKPLDIKNQIIELRSQGKSYRQIQKILNCSKGTICYHLGDGQKEKSYFRTKNRRENLSCLHRKLEYFTSKKCRNPVEQKNRINKIEKVLYEKLKTFNGRKVENMLNIEDVLDKLGDSPVCYLTGTPIDLTKSSTYQLDHIIPSSRGGDNSIDNLGLLSAQANQCKRDLTDKEFIELCRKVVAYRDSLTS